MNEPLEQVCLFCERNDSISETIINRLLSLHNEEVNDWLWNTLEVKEEQYDVNHSSLSEKGKAFVSQGIQAKRDWLSCSHSIARKNVCCSGNAYDPVDSYRLSQRVHTNVAKAKNKMATPTISNERR